MTIINVNDPQVKAAIEAVLHHDELLGQWADGDVEIHPPDRWSGWTDDFRFEPTDADIAWWARESNKYATDYDVEMDLVGLTLSEADPDEFSTPEERREYEEWCESFDRKMDEQRERRDAFLGHPA